MEEGKEDKIRDGGRTGMENKIERGPSHYHNMKTLVIPDIHNKTEQAEKIIAKERPGMTVFLGDYFDSYGEEIEFAQQTALWLKSSLQRPDRIHLIGNHDLSYSSNGIFQCAGFNSFKLWAIGRVLAKEDWNRMAFHCWVGNWLCTHAGVSRQFFDNYSNGRDIRTFMKEEEAEATKSVRSGRYHPFFHCTEARGGLDDYPGILWCDYSEFEDISGTRQIFGHTPDSIVRRSGNHICLDAHLVYYAVYENDKMVIRHT